MTTQENIRAGRDVAGRDITTYIYTAPPTLLGGLIEQLRDKIEKDPDASEFVEKLLSWITPKKTEVTRDLTQKLSDCGKTYLIDYALEAKERFAMQLKKTTFYPGIQEMYALILGEIHTYFNHFIRPKIAASSEVGEIDAAIYELANSIANKIANAPPELGIGIAEIVGMLYYLTGNCHLEWDYK